MLIVVLGLKGQVKDAEAICTAGLNDNLWKLSKVLT